MMESTIGGWKAQTDNDDLVITVDKQKGRVVFTGETEDKVVIRVVPKEVKP